MDTIKSKAEETRMIAETMLILLEKVKEDPHLDACKSKLQQGIDRITETF